MKLNFVKPYNSIEGPVTNGELADFVVLSGPNGSGKSNLLEAIQQGAIEIDGVTSDGGSSIRRFALAELVLPSATASLAPQRRGPRAPMEAHQRIQMAVDALGRLPDSPPPGSDELEGEVRAGLVANGTLSQAELESMLSGSGKRLIDFQKDDFRQYCPPMVGVRDPFTVSISQLFATYHLQRKNNAFDQWCKGVEEKKSVTDEKFVAAYGPPPWDLFNETLSSVEFGYCFEAPPSDEDSVYEPSLVHIKTGTKISTGQLSSGEKTLLVVAMSLYMDSRLGKAIELPQVLLLDETDATLHPSMIKKLLGVLDDISRQRGVKVILATHAPTTVALAPEESIYTMRREGSPRIRHVSRDDALSSLLVGLPTLSVKDEHRRVVFVESEYDQECYQELFGLLRPKLDTPFSLQFIASGRDGQGTCEAVGRLVTMMRDNGNPVHGIVDRDLRKDAPKGVVFVKGRHSLENLILDPIGVALFLLRERKVNAIDMVGTDILHFELSGVNAQTAADYVTSQTRKPGDDVSPVTVRYARGQCVTVPRFVLDTKGHDWEKRLTTTFPQLCEFGKKLKRDVIERALADAPQWIPQDASELFKQLLA